MKLQTEMPLVVLTYPGHFLLTALTIKTYLEYHIPTDIIVLVDDLNPYAWESYLVDCENLYQTQVIPVSQIQISQNYNKGWIRQQIAKLHFDYVIKFDSWFYTDGDIVFLHEVDPTQIGYSLPETNQTSLYQHEYISKVLRISNPGIRVNGSLVCVSDPPFRSMNSQILRQLRQHAGEQITYTGPGMSEWELIENFRYHILGENLNLVRYAPHNLQNRSANLNYFTHQFFTHYGTDAELGRDWFAEQGILTPDTVWNRLTEIRR